MSRAASAQYPRPCSTCGAGSREPCRTLTTGRVTDTHIARIQTAPEPSGVDGEPADAPREADPLTHRVVAGTHNPGILGGTTFDPTRREELAACTCTIIRPAQRERGSGVLIEPPEWEQADDCPIHPR